MVERDQLGGSEQAAQGLSRRAATLFVLAGLLLLPGSAAAQHDHHPPAPDQGWSSSFQSAAFLSANLQHREFRDFHQVESQNWLMGQGSRRLGRGTISLHGMLSFEPFTLRDLGSSQVFQTGETFAGAPLIDYQHPHDLLMGMSAAYERPIGGWRLLLRGGVVDEPALGPTAFMHRASATLHPTAPLAHHQLDSTHISHGVITTGLGAGPWLVETSLFQGREPDENRTDLDLGALDSYAVRGTWQQNGTRAQVSVGWLDEPHVSEPGDVTRLTVSIEREGSMLGRTAAWTLAWGQNRERFDVESAWLAELALQVWSRGTGYLRGELVDKHILGAGGAHPPGQEHPHTISRIGAMTVGYAHELWRLADDRVSIGADLTGYRVPPELAEAYGVPLSAHVFARWSVRRR